MAIEYRHLYKDEMVQLLTGERMLLPILPRPFEHRCHAIIVQRVKQETFGSVGPEMIKWRRIRTISCSQGIKDYGYFILNGLQRTSSTQRYLFRHMLPVNDRWAKMMRASQFHYPLDMALIHLIVVLAQSENVSCSTASSPASLFRWEKLQVK